MVICYECRRQGHMRGECPDLKKKLKNQMIEKTRAMLATQSDEDEGKDKQSLDDEEITCLMAKTEESSEVITSYENFSVDDWEEAYTLLFEKLTELKSKNKSLNKKLNKNLNKNSNFEQFEMQSIKIKNIRNEKKII